MNQPKLGPDDPLPAFPVAAPAREVPRAEMTREQYHESPGLSFSSMKDLAISPLRFWAKHIDPNRVKDEPSPEMQIGSAVHCAVLEPDKFDKRYACELIPPDDCLVTISDIRQWITDKGGKPKGALKADVVAQAMSMPGVMPPNILDVLESAYGSLHAGKVLFKVEDWQRIRGCADALLNEPNVAKALDGAQTEVRLYAKCPRTGVGLRGMLDAVTEQYTVDVKTYQTKNGRSVDQSISAAIWYERYNNQAVFYDLLRSLQPPAQRCDAGFFMAWVESWEPFETRIKVLRPKTHGQVNIYWERARIEVNGLIDLYAECLQAFGVDRPWRYAQEAKLLVDEDVPQVLWS